MLSFGFTRGARIAFTLSLRQLHRGFVHGVAVRTFDDCRADLRFGLRILLRRVLWPNRQRCFVFVLWNIRLDMFLYRLRTDFFSLRWIERFRFHERLLHLFLLRRRWWWAGRQIIWTSTTGIGRAHVSNHRNYRSHVLRW